MQTAGVDFLFFCIQIFSPIADKAINLYSVHEHRKSVTQMQAGKRKFPCILKTGFFEKIRFFKQHKFPDCVCMEPYWFVKKVLSHFFNAKDAKRTDASGFCVLCVNFAIFVVECERIYLTNHLLSCQKSSFTFEI